MTWFQLDDGFHDHPKMWDLSDAATALWIRAATWSSRNLTDGFVPSGMPPRFCQDSDGAVTELVTRGLWRPIKGGWRFHDWHQWNPSREQVLERRRRDAARKRAVRSEGGGNPRGGSAESDRVRADARRIKVKRQVTGGERVRPDSPARYRDSKESFTGAADGAGAPPAPVDREHQAAMSKKVMLELQEGLARRRNGG